MALSIIRAEPAPGGIIADRRLFLSAGRERVLEETATDIAYLLASPGTLIPAADVARHGLRVGDGRIEYGPVQQVGEVANADAGNVGDGENDGGQAQTPPPAQPAKPRKKK